MTLVINALLATFEMMGIFFGCIYTVYLFAVLLSPIEDRLSRLVWKHSSQEVHTDTRKPTFREFSKKHSQQIKQGGLPNGK